MKENIIIEEKLKGLPVALQKEVFDYIEFLLKKYKQKIEKAYRQKFNFDWEGGLSELRDKYTSVELQHKALEWR